MKVDFTKTRAKISNFGDEMGRRGSDWAHTLGNWSHGVQGGSDIPPGPPEYQNSPGFSPGACQIILFRIIR